MTPIHNDFILYAIDGYLYRLTPEVLNEALSDLYTLFSYSSDIDSIKHTMFTFKEKKAFLSISKKERLQRFRKEAGYSQAQAAEAIGISYNHYAKFENGLTSFSFPVHLKTCQVFQKSSECITKEKRSGMVLETEQLDLLRQMEKKSLIRLLETLRVFYEQTKH